MIHAIEGVSEKGIAGTLRARNGQRWRHGEGGGYDPGMLDGGLQRWPGCGDFTSSAKPRFPCAWEAFACLPMLRPPLVKRRSSAGSQRPLARNRILCDISFYSGKDLLAMMTGVEMYALNGL